MSNADIFPAPGSETESEEGTVFAPRFDAHGLIPVVATSAKTGEVLKCGLLRRSFDAMGRRRRIRELEAAILDNPSVGNLEELADQGVDIANGGWGKGSFLRWNRARNDVARAGKVIAREAGRPAHEFCPGRRLDAFDA